MKNTDNKAEFAVKILFDKSKELGRLPKRTDFDDKTVCFIKQKLGPWPRALEAAGLKPILENSSKEKSKIKRQRIKKNKKALNRRNNLEK